MKAAPLFLPLLVVIVASTASAGEASAPRYGSLKVGQLTAMPERGRPASISRRESVDGVFPVVPQWAAQAPAKSREVWVVGDAKQAEELKSGNGNAAAFGASTTCFAEATPVSPFRDRGQQPTGEWGASGFVTSRATLSPRDAEGGTGVQAIHAERVIEQNGTATLEATDAWVDPSTRGARLISKTSLPLTLAGTAAGLAKLYVGRDERPNGKKFVQFVLVMDEKPNEALAMLENEAWVTHDERVIHGACHHMRFGLPTDEAGDAVFHTQVALPVTDAAPAQELGATGFVMKERRSRPLAVSVSVSRVSRDPEPVVSVAFSWSGREQRMMIPQPRR